jgi:hypothetical protein
MRRYSQTSQASGVVEATSAVHIHFSPSSASWMVLRPDCMGHVMDVQSHPTRLEVFFAHTKCIMLIYRSTDLRGIVVTRAIPINTDRSFTLSLNSGL